MELTELHMRILVILSDEEGYSLKELTEIITKDPINKGNISNSLKPLFHSKMIENITKDKSKSRFSYFKYNLHIIKDLCIYKTIIASIYNKFYYYKIEFSTTGEEYKFLSDRGAWADDRILEFLNKSTDICDKHNYFSKAFNDFTFSKYTGEMIKKYGIKNILEAIPMMTVDDYIKFVDWADDNGFTKPEEYLNFITSLSDYMEKQFEKKSKKIF